jgi:hypothetical protein
LARDGAGAGEDCFEQRGLAALERAHQCDAPWTRSSCAVLCHVRLPSERDAAFCETVRAIVSGRRGSWQEAVVSRFRSSLTLAATSDANFGIKGTLATL